MTSWHSLTWCFHQADPPVQTASPALPAAAIGPSAPVTQQGAKGAPTTVEQQQDKTVAPPVQPPSQAPMTRLRTNPATTLGASSPAKGVPPPASKSTTSAPKGGNTAASKSGNNAAAKGKGKSK